MRRFLRKLNAAWDLLTTIAVYLRIVHLDGPAERAEQRKRDEERELDATLREADQRTGRATDRAIDAESGLRAVIRDAMRSE